MFLTNDMYMYNNCVMHILYILLNQTKTKKPENPLAFE